MTILEIRAMTFAGNHASDAKLFRQIDRFCEDPSNPLGERLEAFNIMCIQGMGLPRPASLAEFKEQYPEIKTA